MDARALRIGRNTAIEFIVAALEDSNQTLGLLYHLDSVDQFNLEDLAKISVLVGP